MREKLATAGARGREVTMSWVPDVLQSRVDDARRRMEELEHSAETKVRETATAVRETAQSVVDGATRAVAAGEHYARDVGDAAKNAAASATASANAQLPAIPGAAHRAAQAAKKADAAAKEEAPGARASAQGAAPSFALFTDDALAHAITSQRLKVNSLPEGAERGAAQRELDALESESQRRAERPADAATPEMPASAPTIAERLRPVGMFVAGVGTGFVSGFLGPPGAAAQLKLDAEVNARGTASDKVAFGVGQELAGAAHIGHGIEMALGASAGETITFGGATALAVPVAAVGALEAAGGATLIAGGEALAAKGTVSAARPLRPTQQQKPAGMDDKHILNGEVTYTKSGIPKAKGFHHRGVGTESTARVPRDATITRGPKGTFKADVVEIRDPKTGNWIRKETPTTFFPDAWDKSQVRREILDAYAHRTVDGETWRGISSSGIEIEGHVDSAGNITTAYPKI